MSTYLSPNTLIESEEYEKEEEFAFDIGDEELALLAQRDIDEYRKGCVWECLKCKTKINYKDSSVIMNDIYVHEMICNNSVDYIGTSGKTIKKLCRSKMCLTREDGFKFKSRYFDALFLRFSSQILKETRIANLSEPQDEIYSSLMFSFMKVVGRFARDKKYKKNSDKWFRSFLWRSLRNKKSDIGKMGNYQKRTPLTKCEICGKLIGQVDPNHLLKSGHDIVVDKVIRQLGLISLEGSGEILYYNGDVDKINKRAFYIGFINYYSKSKKCRANIFRSESMNAYHDMFPNSYFKNNLLSTNEPISNDFDVETEHRIDLEPVIFHRKDNVIEDINLRDLLVEMVRIIFSKNNNVLQHYFNESVPWEQRIDIVNEILLEKCTYTNTHNEELDSRFSDFIKPGLSQIVINTIKKDQECRMFINKENGRKIIKSNGNHSKKQIMLGELF